MRKTILLMAFCLSALGYECDHFFKNEKKTETLEFIAVHGLGYENKEAFCEDHNYLDLELTHMPNYFKYREEDDDHYKMMIHRSYSSCTFIYNITQKFITDKSCYSTW